MNTVNRLWRKGLSFIRINTYSMRLCAPAFAWQCWPNIRIHQFFHNHKHDKAEAKQSYLASWSNRTRLGSTLYASEKRRLQDYTIVTAIKKSRMLPIHRDHCGPAPFPLIQFWVLLSTPGVDYKAATCSSLNRRHTNQVEADLGMQPGDALVFDKSSYTKLKRRFLGLMSVDDGAHRRGWAWLAT